MKAERGPPIGPLPEYGARSVAPQRPSSPAPTSRCPPRSRKSPNTPIRRRCVICGRAKNDLAWQIGKQQSDLFLAQAPVGQVVTAIQHVAHARQHIRALFGDDRLKLLKEGHPLMEVGDRQDLSSNAHARSLWSLVRELRRNLMSNDPNQKRPFAY
jgi:hypothetical protein